MRSLHVAAAQIHSGGPLKKTLERIDHQIQAASLAGADVVLFAEGALQGYDYQMTRQTLEPVAEPLDGPSCTRVCAMARRHGITVLLGFIERAGDAFYNSVLVARPDGSRAVERKNRLTGGETGAGLVPGQAERKIFEFNGIKAVIIICADTSIDGLIDNLKARGVDYRFIPTGGGGKIQDMLHEADLTTPEGRLAYTENRPRVFKTEAILSEKECPAIGFTAANALGPAGDTTCHQGHCMIVDNAGVMRAQIPGTIVLEHQQDQMIHARLNFPDAGETGEGEAQ